MKKIIVFVLLVISVVSMGAQQAKLPQIMIVPDQGWCIRNHIVDELGNPDYRKALLNEKMSQLISAMGGIMSDPYGYPVKTLEDCMNELDNEQGLDMVLTSKGDGEIVETDLDKLTRVAKADILIKLSYKVDGYGPRSLIEYNVVAVDAATAKQISGNVGHSSASSAPMSDLVNEAVQGFMDNFCAKLNRHFNNMIEHGREGVVIFKMAEDCRYTFESDVTLNGETGELAEVIEYWLNEHTVDGAFNTTGKTRNRLSFEEVRFPMFGESKFGGKPKALDIRGFMQPIDGFLAQFGISCSFHPSGMGKVYIVLGSK